MLSVLLDTFVNFGLIKAVIESVRIILSYFIYVIPNVEIQKNTILGDKSLPNKNILARARLKYISQKVLIIYNTLRAYDTTLLKTYSYLSINTMLNVVTNNTLSYGQIKWIQPLQDIFYSSPSLIKEHIEW